MPSKEIHRPRHRGVQKLRNQRPRRHTRRNTQQQLNRRRRIRVPHNTRLAQLEVRLQLRHHVVPILDPVHQTIRHRLLRRIDLLRSRAPSPDPSSASPGTSSMIRTNSLYDSSMIAFQTSRSAGESSLNGLACILERPRHQRLRLHPIVRRQLRHVIPRDDHPDRTGPGRRAPHRSSPAAPPPSRHNTPRRRQPAHRDVDLLPFDSCKPP